MYVCVLIFIYIFLTNIGTSFQVSVASGVLLSMIVFIDFLIQEVPPTSEVISMLCLYTPKMSSCY